MGKRIIQQARGKGSLTYRVRKQAFNKKIEMPILEGKAEILKIVHSAAHSAPLAQLKMGAKKFYVPAFEGAVVGDTITMGGDEVKDGNIMKLVDMPIGTKVHNVERNPGDGGKMTRVAGASVIVTKKQDGKVTISMSKRKQVILNENCRAIVGKIAGDGRLLKPFYKAGAKHYKMKARNKLYPRVSAVAMNAVDHPFGSGRGKRVKSKIVQRNASPGRKVGHLRPRRTGYRG